MQAALNPPARDKRQKLWGDMVFRVGDRIMQTKNNYDVLWTKDDGAVGSGIFNGDVGVIEDIDPAGELLTIRFDDRTAVYTADLLAELDMAYAMTVHKSQGSEYPAVVLVSAPAAPSLMVRGVLYTAITRARRLLVLVGDDVTPVKMAANDRAAAAVQRPAPPAEGGDGMSANDWLDKLQRNMLDLFFPRHCPFCGRIVGRELLCGTCKASLPYCGEVRTGGFGRCAAPLYYEDAVREAILAFKFKGKLEALDCFGSLMAQTAAEAFSGAFDAVTWAPVSRKRLRQRGYDQARLLCASLCVDWHMKPQETLRKVRDNPAQSGMEDAAARRANVLGVYEAVRPADIAGKRFLLVDDILTTGATLGECVRVLKEAGAADAVCLTLAAVREDG